MSAVICGKATSSFMPYFREETLIEMQDWQAHKEKDAIKTFENTRKYTSNKL